MIFYDNPSNALLDAFCDGAEPKHSGSICFTGETQSSSLSGTIYASIIDPAVLAYQYDECNVAPFFAVKNIAGEFSDTARFPRLVKSTGPVAGTPASETTYLTSATELTTTSATVQVSRVGMARELTTTAAEDSILGRALYVMGFAKDAARLYGEFYDTTATALFSSITATVGPSGQALTIPTMVAAVASQRANKARGQQVFSMHDNQLKQFQTAQINSVSTAWGAFYAPNGVGGQFGGVFMGNEIWASGLNPTSTGDRLGAIWSLEKEYCGLSYVIKRPPSSLTQTNVLNDSNYWASFARVGFGIIANNFCTSIRSLNA